MNPFELALGVEAKQPMDLTIPRNTHHEGGKEAEKMAKECEERKACAIKLLEKNACELCETSQQVANAHKIQGKGPNVVKHKGL
jgi:hypothetical protein